MLHWFSFFCVTLQGSLYHFCVKYFLRIINKSTACRLLQDLIYEIYNLIGLLIWYDALTINASYDFSAQLKDDSNKQWYYCRELQNFRYLMIWYGVCSERLHKSSVVCWLARPVKGEVLMSRKRLWSTK